jgi:cytochrome P450
MCASNVFAGSDSTAATARALVYFVLKDPECERRLIHELLDARRVGRLSGDVVRRREAEQLPYFMACLYETYRLFPQPALGLPRVVPEGGLEVNGKFIPQGVSARHLDR